MSNPLFLTGANESKMYDLGSSPYSDASNTLTGINVPENANTLVTAYNLDISSRTFDSISLSDGSNTIAPLATFNHRRTTSGGANTTVVVVYDVSQLGAMTCSQSTTISSSTSNPALCLVLMSEGFLQSGLNSAGFGDEYDFSIYNPNAANCSIANIVLSDGQDLAALTEITSPLFTIVDLSGTSSCSAFCVGSYDSAAFQDYAYKTNLNTGKRFQEVQLVFSSQPDPFDGITGKLTSPIIK